MASREFEWRARRIFQGEFRLRAIEARDRPAVQLPYQFIRGTHDQIDHFRVERFLLRESAAFRDGLLRYCRVASAPLREAPQKRRRISVDFLSEGIVNLHGQKATDSHDGRGRARMRTRRHRRDVRGEQDVEARGGSAPARRRDVHGHRHRGRKDVLDHVLHRCTESARRVHGD